MNLRTDYDLLYTNGCSFTNHMPQPDSEKWPHHLKNILQIRNLFNHGEGASSNFGIFRRTNDFFSKTQINKSKILAVIQLTYAERFELPRQDGFTWKNYLPNLDLTGSQESQRHSDYFEAWIRLIAEDPVFELWYFYNQASAISNVLRAHNVDHYFVTMDNPTSRFEMAWDRPHTPGPIYNKVFSGTPIDFDQNTIRWMFENISSSEIIKILSTANYNKSVRYISDTDSHYSNTANYYIAEQMSMQIRRLDNFKNLKIN